jgi:membrane protein implicated in regulation of membrane protease activity
VTQTYDEYGEIYLGGGSLVKFVSKYNHGQQWALTLSILVVLVLSTYAAYLHRRVSRNRAWKPRVGYSNDPLSKLEDIGREHSGIISGRSYDKTSGYLV